MTIKDHTIKITGHFSNLTKLDECPNPQFERGMHCFANWDAEYVIALDNTQRIFQIEPNVDHSEVETFFFSCDRREEGHTFEVNEVGDYFSVNFSCDLA